MLFITVITSIDALGLKARFWHTDGRDGFFKHTSSARYHGYLSLSLQLIYAALSY